MIRPETKYQQELKISFKHLYPNSFYLKIPDMPLGTQQREDLPDFIRFNPKKPFDIIVVINGIPVGIETKVSALDNISLSILTDRQEEKLLDFHNAGGKAFLSVKSKLSINIAYNFDIITWIELKKMLKNVGKVSSPNSMVRVKINKKLVWDVSEFVGDLKHTIF